MDASVEALTVFIVLLPGFLSGAILNAVVVRAHRDAFTRTIEALIFSFLIYAVIGGVSGRMPIQLDQVLRDGQVTYQVAVDRPLVGWTALVAMALPLAFSTLLTHDVHMAVLRFLKVTKRTSRNNTWLDVFSEQDRYVVVEMNDGRRVSGWPLYYSDTPTEGLIYLQDPAWIDRDGTYIPLDVHGLFLVRREDVVTIAFQRRTSDEHAKRAEEVQPNEHT